MSVWASEGITKADTAKERSKCRGENWDVRALAGDYVMDGEAEVRARAVVVSALGDINSESHWYGATLRRSGCRGQGKKKKKS